MENIKHIIPDKKRKNYFYLNEENCTKFRGEKIYKYINLDSAILCLSNKSLRFVQPSEWQDKYEMRFYKANYAKLGLELSQHPSLYACCFTTEKMSEAAWKVYAKESAGLGSHCVKFEIQIEKLRDILNAFAEKNDCTIYESRMIYSLTDDEINKLHKVTSPLYRILFENFKLESYLTLLSIKRPAFTHESELRFFIIPKKKDVVDKPLDIGIPWENVTTKISIDKNCTFTEEMILSEYWGRISKSKIIVKELLHNNPDRVITIDGFKQYDNVLEIIKSNPGISMKAIYEIIGGDFMKLKNTLKSLKREGCIICNITENNDECFTLKI